MVEGAHDHEQCPGDGDCTRCPKEVFADGLPRHVDECGGDAVAAIRLDDSVEPPDGEEGGGGNAEADFGGIGGPNRQPSEADDEQSHVLHDEAGDVAAGHQDAGGDRVPRPRARHERGGYAHRIHGERRDHSQKRQTHNTHCARWLVPAQDWDEAWANSRVYACPDAPDKWVRARW